MNTAKNMLALAGAAAFAAGIATPAAAAVNISGYVSSITGYTGNNGLQIDAQSLGSWNPITLNDINDTTSRFVFKIGAPSESTVNIGEDTIARQISVAFTFTDPTGVSGTPITGTTVGFYRYFTECGLIAGGCGRVTWGDDPTIFTFGNGGSFGIKLSDVEFPTGGGYSKVKATFEYLSAAGAVPEPSTWAMMIIGFGMIGAGMRRRQKQTVRYSFA